MTFSPPRAPIAFCTDFDPAELNERAAGLGVTAATDKTDMKERIMRAYENGQLTPFETRVLVLAWGLEAA